MREPTPHRDESFFNVNWDAEFAEEISERERKKFEIVAKEVVERQMTAPALMLLESVKPVSFLLSQLFLFFEPFVAFIFSYQDVLDLRRALEKREGPELLMTMIEDYDRKYKEAHRTKRHQSIWGRLKKIINKKK